MNISLNAEPIMQASIDRSCPVCRGSDPVSLWSKAGMCYMRCGHCTMVYANPVPKTFVTGQFYQDRTQDFYLSATKLTADYDPVRFQREWRLFRSWVSPGRVLDVGCSTGGFLRGLIPLGFEVLGQDVSTGALQQAERVGIRVTHTPFLELSGYGDSFDAVTFWAVLEHVMEPHAFLAHAHRLLRPGGMCMVLVPNLHSLAIRLLGARYRYVMPEHINFFSPRSLRTMVESTGEWEVKHLGSMHFNPVVLLQDMWRGGHCVPDSERAGLLKRTNRWKKHPALGLLRWGYRCLESLLNTQVAGDNLTVVLQKK